MNCRVFLLLAALTVCGCKSSSVPGVDPFFGRTAVPPQPTGSIGRPGDPAYAIGPGGQALPPPSYGMPGSVSAPSGMGTGAVVAPGGATSFPANSSGATTSGGLPWTRPGTPVMGGATTGQSWPYTSAPASGPSLPAASGSLPTSVPAGVPSSMPAGAATRSPYGTPYYPSGSGASVPPSRVPASSYPAGTGAGPAAGYPSPGVGTDYYRGTSTSPAASSQSWTTSAGGATPSSNIRIIEPPSRYASPSLAGTTGSEAGSMPDAAAIVAERPRIVRNLSARAGSDPTSAYGTMGTNGRTIAPAGAINIADLPPAEGAGTTIR